MEPIDVLQDGVVSVSTETYAVCRAEQGHPDAFGTVRDGTETTVIIDHDRVDSLAASEVESGWKRVTFEMELPFELVGFLGEIATALAQVDVSVFVLSSYSTDHVFVKETELDAAITRLEELGCIVRTESS